MMSGGWVLLPPSPLQRCKCCFPADFSLSAPVICSGSYFSSFAVGAISSDLDTVFWDRSTLRREGICAAVRSAFPHVASDKRLSRKFRCFQTQDKQTRKGEGRREKGHIWLAINFLI